MRLKQKHSLGRKGSLTDLPFYGSVILFFGIAVLIGFKLMSSINTEVQTMDNIGADGKAAASVLTSHYSGVFDNVFLLLTMGIGMATLMMAALVRIHPVFIAFFIIGLIIIIFLSGIMSNIYQEMASDPMLSAEAEQMVFMTTIMNLLPLIIGIFGLILMAVMYKTWQVNL